MAGDKDGLVSELRELRDKLLPTMERDRARVEAEGRPFNVLDWMLGRPISEKYPAGPPFRVRGVAALGNSQALDACAKNLHRGTMLTRSRIAHATQFPSEFRRRSRCQGSPPC
jgi:hypothetical protein